MKSDTNELFSFYSFFCCFHSTFYLPIFECVSFHHCDVITYPKQNYFFKEKKMKEWNAMKRLCCVSTQKKGINLGSESKSIKFYWIASYTSRTNATVTWEMHQHLFYIKWAKHTHTHTHTCVWMNKVLSFILLFFFFFHGKEFSLIIFVWELNNWN